MDKKHAYDNLTTFFRNKQAEGRKNFAAPSGRGYPPDIRVEWVRIPSKACKKEKPPQKWQLFFFLVTRRGFEPRTHCLKGSCSAN